MKDITKKTEEEPQRILGRRLAVETTLDELEAAHGSSAARKTFTLRFPPDRD